ncbi:MAG TPA: GFA family protein [Polyangia bacterium]
MTSGPLTGGCQCGAVRFAIEGGLGRASICHCRMCQKAFGNAFAPLVTARGLTWKRGAPKRFRSSNKVLRGFCGDCGTPLTYEPDGMDPEIAIGALDDPGAVPPVIQVGLESRLAWTNALPELPTRTEAERAKVAPFFAGIISNQHPDAD